MPYRPALALLLTHAGAFAFTCPAQWQADARPYYPDPLSGDCTAFYHCTATQVFHWPCPAHQRFDAISRSCQPAAFVHCGARPSPFTCPASWPTDTRPYYADPASHDCSTFYYCTAAEVFHWPCMPHTRFDEASRSCVAAHHVPCEGGARRVSPYACPPSWVTEARPLYADPASHDCTRYYRCSARETAHYTCVAGTRFDVARRACVDEREVACAGGVGGGGGLDGEG